ncbi:MAG: ribosome maturation factor RimP [Christensenellales bacterium]|jgi:ribosome maturation factor RimP
MAKTQKTFGRPQNAKQIETKVFALMEEPVKQLGFELCEVEYAIEDGNNVLTLYIYNEKGVSIDDCELVSRAVDPLLDEADPIEDPYYLSVSSLGLDRPFKKPRDFERKIGTEITVSLYAPLNGKKQLTGTLLSADGSGFAIQTEKGELRFEYKSIASAKPFLKF